MSTGNDWTLQSFSLRNGMEFHFFYFHYCQITMFSVEHNFFTIKMSGLYNSLAIRGVGQGRYTFIQAKVKEKEGILFLQRLVEHENEFTF